MKRKLLRFDKGTGILEQGYSERTVQEEEGRSHISCITVRKMDEPWMWNLNGEIRATLVQGGKWLRIVTEGKFYSIAAILDPEDRIVLWYIDMIAGQGVNAEGRYYFDDLYLDLIVLPDGTMYEDDRDELEDALRDKDITEEQFQLALRTADFLRDGMLQDLTALTEYTFRCYAPFRNAEPDEIMQIRR